MNYIDLSGLHQVDDWFRHVPGRAIQAAFPLLVSRVLADEVGTANRHRTEIGVVRWNELFADIQGVDSRPLIHKFSLDSITVEEIPDEVQNNLLLGFAGIRQGLGFVRHPSRADFGTGLRT